MTTRAEDPAEGHATAPPPPGRGRWRAGCALVLAAALAATVPALGDLGLTWDEPEYRQSELISAEWWGRLASARSWADVAPLLEPDALLYYWPYARSGAPNVHPPLAGQVCSLTHAAFGRWFKDVASRRLASAAEFALTVTIVFGFLARRYGAWVGGVSAGALLFTPRVFGDGLIAATDTPGLLLWSAAAVSFWNALHAGTPSSRSRWRVLVGVLLGLSFLTKMSAVMVVLPLSAWLALGHLPRAIRRGGWPAWLDGAWTLTAVLAPLVLALAEVARLARRLPPPGRTDLYVHRPPSAWPGLLLAAPLAVWLVRRLTARLARGNPVLGTERPALEVSAAALAVAPVVAWLGNPEWWRETFTRLAHFAALQAGRREDYGIQILYLGRTYAYSLPWHNAWVLTAVTVPAGILAASGLGLVHAVLVARRDRLPLYFVANLVTLPVLRMTDTPAHDGVRLFLPTFVFLAGLAGWGTVRAADALARLARVNPATPRAALAALVLGPAAWQLASVHPYELSYYNELVGGPRGASAAGFERTYWYDAFTPRAVAEVNARLPRGATLDVFNPLLQNRTPAELQSLGELRADLLIGSRGPAEFPFVLLLSCESKATAFSRLLYAMRPWYASRPGQVGGLRMLTVADPEAVSRAWALQLLADAPSGGPPEPSGAPEWVGNYAPWLGRFWGEGLSRYPRLNVHEETFAWARRDPEGLRAAARAVAAGGPLVDPKARALFEIVARHDPLDPPGRLASRRLLRGRPEALVEAAEILTRRGDDVRAVMTRDQYTDEDAIGGFLDSGVGR